MRSTAIALALLVAACLSACGGGADRAAEKPRLSSAPTTGPRFAPLTGVETSDPTTLTRPALSVKVDNRPEARPQVGLDAADIVFEELTEGGITRFLAVFQSKLPLEVGPIRSVRAVDPALVTPLRGVVAYSGGTPPNVQALNSAPVIAVDETAAGDAMHRDPKRARPHDLIGTPAKLVKDATRGASAPRAWFTYGVALPSARAIPCAHVSVAFSRRYDSVYNWASGEGWRRSTPDGPFVVASGRQIAPTNVVVLWIRDQSARATVGRGDALVLRDGTVARGTWERSDVSEPFRLLDATGAGLRLTAGTTWLHLAIVNNAAVTTCAPGGQP